MVSFWRLPDALILASASLARRSMLENARIPINACPSTINEREIERSLIAQNASAMRVASALAKAKALDVSRQFPHRLVLGADQTLMLRERLLHKCANRPELEKQLIEMAGRTHHLFSAAAVAQNGRIRFSTISHASVSFRQFSSDFMQYYLDVVGHRALETVGGYEMEGLGVHFIERAQGQYSTILGLPLPKVLEGFRKIGALAG